jgi:hypothetical protein
VQYAWWSGSRMPNIFAKPISTTCTALLVLALSGSALLAQAEPSNLPARRTEQEGLVWIDMLANEFDDWVVEGKKTGSHVQPPDIWTLHGGILHCDGRGFGFLRFKRQVSDFVFAGEFRLARGSNSGIGIRTIPYVSIPASRPSNASYEIQLIDNPGEVSAKGNMSIYRYFAPSSNPQKPHDQWNAFEITCCGPRLLIRLNGVTVHDIDQSLHEAIKTTPLSGFVSVQNHHSVVDFRNLRLRELDP